MELQVIYDVPQPAVPWPTDDMMDEMMDADFSQFVSFLQTDTMLAEYNLNVGIGDSRNMVRLVGRPAKGEEWHRQFKTIGTAFAQGIRDSLGSMSGDYKKMYGRVLKDFDKNGIIMPDEEKLL